MKSQRLSRFRAALERLKKLFKKEPEPPAADPYAYVTAPKKPRPSNRSAAAVAEMEE
jgi:alkanesulfonate monooxygenase SsuD/methylene tetrahydromethanopterin reductase-like flavin-dependent oxidoreductase (luciferase family)